MKTLRKIVVFLILLTGFSAYGQNNCGYQQIITTIDSISKVKNIETGIVKVFYITNLFDETKTTIENLTYKSRFYFDGQFLVIENKYFNINKLLYFCVEEDIIEFFFQAY